MLGWWIIGAIISPERFLPFATTSAVIITFISTMYSKLKRLHKSLQDAANESVTEQIRIILLRGLNMQEERIRNKVAKFSSKVTDKVFGKSVNKFLKEHGYSKISQGLIDAMVIGDMSALLDMMNKNCGIDKIVGLALIGFIKQDNIIILDSIDKLTKKLKIDNAEFVLTV